ncbi:MAG: hypothetical protein KDC81_14110 [Flavobacteriaceae bacterium]|nr:hypothetical protein [Flavobacteriaceae bacterium]
MAQNLVDVHSLLNDTSNDFLNNVNSDPMASGTPYTLDQLMNLVTWIGLEETQEFINNILNNPTQLANKNYVENAARQKYTPNCTN